MSNQDAFYLGVAWAYGLVNHWGEIDYNQLSKFLGTAVNAPDSDEDALHILDLIRAAKYANSL